MLLKILTLTISIFSCISLRDYRLSYQQGKGQAINDIFPGNYTLREILSTDTLAGNLLLSPDQNWILYRDPPNSISTNFYFRHRKQLFAKQITLGRQKYDEILGWTFNKMANFLFVGTDFGYVYVCKFSQNMTSEDYQIRFQSNLTNLVYSFSINQANQLALGIGQNCRVFNVLASGELIQVTKRDYSLQVTRVNVYWHPKNANVLIVGCCNYSNDGFISFFNITSNQSIDANTSCIQNMVVVGNPNIIISRNSSSILDAYFFYEGTNLTSINIRKDVKLRSIQLSYNGNLLIGWNYDKTKIQVHKVTIFLSPVNSPNYSSNPNGDIPFIVLDLVYEQLSASQSFSVDANEFITSDGRKGQIQFYSMCARGSFYANDRCSKCTNNCLTCHIARSLCTQCLNNSFVMSNQSCLSCSIYLAGSLTCSNQNYCLSCNQSNNFNPLPVNASCICQESYFLSQTTCKPCDSLGVCRICESQTSCTECNVSKGYTQKPVNSSCVCRIGLSTFNNTCVECGIEGCSRCLKVNECFSCSQEQGYEPNVGIDGRCVKKNIFSLVIILSIAGGCVLIGIFIFAYFKCIRNRPKQRQKLREEAEIRQELVRQSSEIHRQSVPKFEQIQKIVRQSIGKQIKPQVLPVIDKKEYAKYSDAQKIRLRRLLSESLFSNN